MLKCLAGSIEFAKTQSCGCEIEMAVETVWDQACDLRAPGNSFNPIFFFSCFGQDVERRQRIAVDFQRLFRGSNGAGVILLLQHTRGVLKEARLVPAFVKF